MLVSVLNRFEIKATMSPYDHIFDAAANGDVDELTRMLDDGADIEASKKNGVTALHVAAINGHDDCMRLLLEYGADADAVTDCGSTALYIAVWFEHPTCVQVLLDHNAEIENEDDA